MDATGSIMGSRNDAKKEKLSPMCMDSSHILKDRMLGLMSSIKETYPSVSFGLWKMGDLEENEPVITVRSSIPGKTAELEVTANVFHSTRNEMWRFTAKYEFINADERDVLVPKTVSLERVKNPAGKVARITGVRSARYPTERFDLTEELEHFNGFEKPSLRMSLLKFVDSSTLAFNMAQAENHPVSQIIKAVRDQDIAHRRLILLNQLSATGLANYASKVLSVASENKDLTITRKGNTWTVGSSGEKKKPDGEPTNRFKITAHGPNLSSQYTTLCSSMWASVEINDGIIRHGNTTYSLEVKLANKDGRLIASEVRCDSNAKGARNSVLTANMPEGTDELRYAFDTWVDPKPMDLLLIVKNAVSEIEQGINAVVASENTPIGIAMARMMSIDQQCHALKESKTG